MSQVSISQQMVHENGSLEKFKAEWHLGEDCISIIVPQRGCERWWVSKARSQQQFHQAANSFCRSWDSHPTTQCGKQLWHPPHLIHPCPSSFGYMLFSNRVQPLSWNSCPEAQHRPKAIRLCNPRMATFTRSRFLALRATHHWLLGIVVSLRWLQHWGFVPEGRKAVR